MSIYPKVTFGIIVLNGEPFTKYCLRSLYRFAHEIIVVEGASQKAGCISTPDGHSRDDTLESLHKFKELEDPENKLKIITRDGFWSEKDEQSQAYAEMAAGDYLWQVDIDEFYMPEDMDYILKMLKNIPEISGVSFKQITFWGDVCYRCDSTFPLLNGSEPVYRIFKFGEGYRYTNHRPPTVVDHNGVDLKKKKYVDAEITASKGIYLYHYSLLLPKQVQEKVTYYRNLPYEQCRSMPQWAQDNYHRISNPYNVFNVHTYPGWLERYNGKHPPQIYNMMNDIQTKKLDVETRCNVDVEEFIDNPKYRSGINLIKEEYKRRVDKTIKMTDPIFGNEVFREFLEEYALKGARSGRPDVRCSRHNLAANRKQKQLSIVHINTHDRAGGAAKVAWRLAEAQRNAGCDSIMLVGQKTSDSRYSFSFPTEANRSLRIQCRQQGQLYYEFQGSHKLVSNPLVLSADILHLHNLHGDYFNPFSLSPLSHLKPTVWTLHDMQSITAHCAHSFNCQRWESGCEQCPSLSIYPEILVDTSDQLYRDKRLVYDNSYLNIVTPSQWLKDKVQRSILRNHPVELIYNGIDTSIFGPYDKLEARKKFGIPVDVLVIGAVAHCGALDNPWKGGNYTRAVFGALQTKLPGHVFVNIGGNSQSNDSRIIDIPNINDESELAQAYSMLDIFLYTPTADNCPLVVLEALSCGIPIVTFDTGGVPELVRDGLDGYVSPYKDVHKLVQALEKLATQTQLRAEFSRNARQEAIARFDHKKIAQQYQELYERCLRQRKSKAIKAKLLPLELVPKVILSDAFIKAENTKKALTCDVEKKREAKCHDNFKVSGDNGLVIATNIALNHHPKISIVTPSFNQGQFLEECIDSILSQNYPNLEYIIMDGGSTDGSVEIIKKYEKYLTYWQSKPDGGQYAAIDQGFKRTSGEIMAWLNSDDKYHPNSLFNVAHIFGKHPDVEWITGRPTSWNKNGQLINVGWLPSWCRENFIQPCPKEYYIQQESTFWKRMLWEKAGAKLRTDLKFAGDLELWIRFFRHAQLYTVDALLGGFRHHPNQKTKLCMDKYNQEAELLINQEITYIKKTGSAYMPPAPKPISSKENFKLTIATTISPKDIERQSKAIDSWIKLGFKVVSINCAEEIGLLQPSFPDIKFIQAKRDAREMFGRPVIYFDDFLEYFKKDDSEVCGIVNSDIFLFGDKGIISFIKEHAKDSLVYGSRIDVDSLEILEGDVYEDGFDFFFFDKSLISCFPKSDFCVGMPWWDYWVPLIPALENIQLKRLVSGFAYHLKHFRRWDEEHYNLLAKRIFEYLHGRTDGDFYSTPDSNPGILLAEMLLAYRRQDIMKNDRKEGDELSTGIISPCIIDFLKLRSSEIYYSSKELADRQNALVLSQKKKDIFVHKTEPEIQGADSLRAEYEVSIVLCTKDRAELLDRMLASLKEAAKRVTYEVIVVEGGSSDDTLDVLRKHNVRKVYSESEWLGPDRHSWPKLYNFGFSEANGKWAMCASDDIVFSKGCISEAILFLNKQSNDVAGGVFFYKNVYPTNPEWGKYGIDFTYGQKLLMNYGLVSLDCFRKVGGLDEAYRFYCADTDFCYKLYERGLQLIPLPSSFIAHDNVLDEQKKANYSASDRDIELLQRRWKHFVPAEIPEPRRLTWQEDLFEAFNLPSNLEKINSGIESFWHGLAYFQRELFEKAKSKLVQAVESRCDHWLVHWLLANAAYKCEDKALAEKAVRQVIKLAPAFVSDDCLRAALARVFCDRGSQLPIDQITDFNQRSRDRWLAEKAANISPGLRVLDVGAGTCPYRSLFSHCDYKTHDFKKLEKIELGDTEGYGQIDYVSDITNIPVDDASFDVVICTEVLEHIPEPIKAIAEMTRILRPGGQLLLTAPLGSGLHQLPFHFYGGFTPQWYKHFLPRFGLELQEVQPNGGFFKMLAQECARVAWTLPKHRALHGDNAGIIQYIFGQAIPRYLFAMDERCFIDQFTVGYHIRAAKTQKLVFPMKDNVSECIGQSDAAPAVGLTALIFSKDRALQLQATIDSFQMYCRDSITANLGVLFKASNQVHREQYERLKEKFPAVAFVEETDFRQQVLSAIENCKYMLFLVDDNIFVKPFSFKGIIAALDSEKKAAGFSLRLGKNTTYCYMLGSEQKLPAFDCVREGILKYYWPDAECDFGYPLELSSSVYRSDEILRLLNQVDFSNPNTLESEMSRNKNVFVSTTPFLLTFEQSVTFCNPINVVQRVYENNKFGTIHRYTSEQLADCFSRGMAIDVQKYVGFTPDSAHQEVELYFKPADRVISEAQTTGTGCEHQGKVLKPEFSIVMANYNNDKYIGQAIESVLSQTFTDWELIIVDDCSTDDSLNVIKKYLGDTHIKLVQHKENRGYTAALKTGIANVQSEYFGVLDSDDCLLPNAVETMHVYHVKFPDCGLIYSQFAYCHQDLTQRSIGFCDKIPPGKTALDVKVVSHFKTFKLHDYLKTSGYDETILYAEDVDIVYKMEEVTGLKFVDECLYFYRELHTSICHSESKINVAIMSRVKARINALKRRCAVLAESGDKNFEDLFAQAIKQARAVHKDVEQYFVVLAELYENNLLLPALSLPADFKGRDAEGRLLWLAANVNIKFDKLFELLASQQDSEGQPLVTVYMVTYNTRKFIAQAIDSVLSQVYKNFEILIVDDGSTDKTKELIASYSDDRIRYIYKEHKNYASGVNRAVAEAKGKYIMVVDSDDFIAPDYIEKMVAFAEKHPQTDYFYPAQLTLVNESGNQTGQQWSYMDFSENSVLPAFLFKNGYGPIPNPGSLKRRTLFDKVGLYDEVDTVEDFVFLCKNAPKINFKRVDEHSTYFYRRHRQSNSLKFEARNRIMADVLNEMVSIYPAEVLYPQIADISDADSKEQRYYEYVVETFCRHSSGPMVQFGHYFQEYADYYKSKLLRITAPAAVLRQQDAGVPK